MSIAYPEVSDADFKTHFLAQDFAQCKRVLRFLMWVSLPLLYIDFTVLGNRTAFFVMCGLRFGVWAYATWVLQTRWSKVKEQNYETHLYRWAILVLVTQFASNALSPNAYLGHFFIDIWICFIASIVVPLRKGLLKALVLSFFAASMALALTKTFPTTSHQLTLVAVLLLSVYSGQSLAFYMQQTRRKVLGVELELQRKENTDGITGVANRREFLRVANNELQRHARLGKPLSLMIVDLDHLKRINRTYGAVAGDMVLVEVSKRLKRATRNYDCLARYGTEEFGVLLPEASEEVASRIAIRAKATIEAMPIAALGKELRVVASVGFTTLHESDNLETMLERAEASLRVAKMGAKQDATEEDTQTNHDQAFA